MGFFDFFINEKKSAPQTRSIEPETYNFSNNQNAGNNSSSAIQVFFPKNYDDVSAIIDILALGKSAIVNIKDLKETTAIRVLDLLSGAIYALHGGLCELDKGLFLFSTDGVNIKQ